MALILGGYEVWIAISGTDTNYGGCQIWTSFSGENYALAGVLNGASNYGVLTADLPTGADPDTNPAHVLSVNLTLSGGNLASVRHDDAKNYRSLCLAGGEFVSFRDAKQTGSVYDLTMPNPQTLTGQVATAVVSAGEIQFDGLTRNSGYYDGGTVTCTAGTAGNIGVTRTISTYVNDTENNLKTVHCAAFPVLPDRTDVFTVQALPYVRRGLYGSSKGAVAGDTFVRCDNRLFRLPFLAKDVGSTLHLKFLSYNQFGQGLQNLADMAAYSIMLSNPLQGATAADTYYQWVDE